MEVYYYINNQEVDRPLNYKELTIELNFDKDKDKDGQSISLTEFEFGLGSQTNPSDVATLINTHINNGFAFEGLPILLELENNGATYNLFDGYLNVATAAYDCDRVVLQGAEKKNIDWLNDVADSKSFDYLYEVEGIVTDNDFINIPYVLSSLPDNGEALTAFISMAFIVDSIVGQVKDVSELTAGFTAWPNGSDIAKFVFSVLYTIALLIFAIMTIKQIINSIIQPIKYHTGMSELRHCQKGAASFGYTFASSILENAPYNKSYIIPPKYNQDEYDDEDSITGIQVAGVTGQGSVKMKRLGNKEKYKLGRGYFNGTVGDFFREMKKKYNAKIIIEGNVLKLERKDYNNSSYNYIVPAVDQTSYALNSDDLKSNYIVRFQTDINDKNTIQRYNGNVTQVITSPTGGRTDYTLINGLEEVNIQFARATEKVALTNAEKVIKLYLNIVDAYVNIYIALAKLLLEAIKLAVEIIALIVQVLNLTGAGIPVPNPDGIGTVEWVNLSGSVDDRKGMILMENDFIEVTKNVILDVNDDPRYTKVNKNTDYLDIIFTNSLYLYQRYHFINSFVPSVTKPNANQYKLFDKVNVPFCFNDYKLIKDSNYLQDDEQRNGEVISLKWNVEQQTASINYKVNELYTNRLKETKITPNGK